MKDFNEIKGQWHVKRGLEVAASGDHGVILIGPPGSGKSALIKALRGLLSAIGFSNKVRVVDNIPTFTDDELYENSNGAGNVGSFIIGTMLPCPCGFFTDPRKECHCTPLDIQRYLSRVPQGFLDKIDITLEVPVLKYRQLSGKSVGESTEIIAKRVLIARSGNKIPVDKLDKEAEELLKLAILELGMNAKGYDKVVKIAATIARMDNKDMIGPEHVSEAINYRSLDRNLGF